MATEITEALEKLVHQGKTLHISANSQMKIG